MNYISQKDWLLLIAISFLFVAIGALIDLFLKRDDVRKLHDRCYRFSVLIADMPLEEWQNKIAKVGLLFINILGSWPARFFDTVEMTTYDGEQTGNKEYREHERVSKYFSFWMTIYLLFFIPSLGYTIYKKGILNIIILITPFSLIIILLFIIIYLEMKYNKYFPGLDYIFRLIFYSSIISAGITFLANFCSITFIPSIYLNSLWYEGGNNTIYPLTPFLMTVINYPFDFFTLAISYLLLKRIVLKKNSIIFVAVLDFSVSLMLTCILHSTFTIIKSGGNFICELKNSFDWLTKLTYSIATNFRHNNIDFFIEIKELHLAPVLVTTFLPVSIYLSIFLFITLLKPPQWLSSRFFMVISEREESVFKQLALTVSLIMAAVKAFYDYIFLFK